MILTNEMVLNILENNSGATYYIANLIKNVYPEWERETSKVLSILKKLETINKIKRYDTSYKRQLSWKIVRA